MSQKLEAGNANKVAILADLRDVMKRQVAEERGPEDSDEGHCKRQEAEARPSIRSVMFVMFLSFKFNSSRASAVRPLTGLTLLVERGLTWQTLLAVKEHAIQTLKGRVD